MIDIQKQLEERRNWLEYLVREVKPGKIVEFGCGSGFVLEILAKEFPDSIIIGVDKVYQRLENVAEKNLKNVIPVNADFTQNIFPNNVFDTAMFVGTLHEVFSYHGEKEMDRVIKMGYDVLKNSGILIIQDFVAPLPKPVKMIFKNRATKNKFFRFAREFRPRKVAFKEIEHGVEVDIRDALEFISKYRSPDEDDWEEEMSEIHFFFTGKDFQKILQKTGFEVKNIIRLSKSKDWFTSIQKDIEFESLTEYQWIQLVGVKTERI